MRLCSCVLLFALFAQAFAMLVFHAQSVVEKRLPVFVGNVENVRTATSALIATQEVNMTLITDSVLSPILEQQSKYWVNCTDNFTRTTRTPWGCLLTVQCTALQWACK